jgi:2-oxoglutarate ferredoxin oxidoreductase subunit alpha
MMEAVQFPDYDIDANKVDHSSWATTGRKNMREKHVVTSLHLQAEDMEEMNNILQRKYRKIEENEVRYDAIHTQDTDIIVVAFGMSARVAHKAVDLAREDGINVGLFRPQTLYPFPEKELNKLADHVVRMLVVEMNAGQMLEDVKLSVNGKIPVDFYGRMGGVIPSPEDILIKIKENVSELEVS